MRFFLILLVAVTLSIPKEVRSQEFDSDSGETAQLSDCQPKLQVKLTNREQREVNAFFDYLSSEVVPLLQKVKFEGDLTEDMGVVLEKSTRLLQVFRPGWEVVLSTKLSKKDPCPTLIELRGESEEINFHSEGQRHEIESKFFLEKAGARWLARSTYYNRYQTYRAMGRAYVQIPDRSRYIFACYATEICDLFPFAEGRLEGAK